ncbi:MAG: sulfotransferase family protein [Nocardiopsaceae bacterium]|nr:sulfotransferase family protein [Nocardiopsaceae bacterium]
MRLIGAGLPRTATLTQKIALEMLGVGPCYHMANIFADLSTIRLWSDAFEGNADWDRLLDGHQSIVDWPGAYFYRELMDVYPDAKVLLSVRSGESWARSMRDTIWATLYGDNLMHDLSSARGRLDPDWALYCNLLTAMWEKSGLLGPSSYHDESSLIAGMEHYNDEVRRTVPPERLLVWSPADGWGPLCEFLQTPVPSEPVPHVNDSAMFADLLNDAAIATLVSWQEQRRETPAAS